MNYIERKACAVTGEAGLERLTQTPYPLHCGCTEQDESKDIIANECFAISKKGVLQLQKLIPLELLYENEHGSGATGQIWQDHHAEFAKFILKFNPSNVLEIGGGHSRLALNLLKKEQINYTIIEPNPKNKLANVSYIEGFFDKKVLENRRFDCVVHSHTLEHIYEPNAFLEDISACLGANLASNEAHLNISNHAKTTLNNAMGGGGLRS